MRMLGIGESRGVPAHGVDPPCEKGLRGGKGRFPIEAERKDS